MATLLSSVTADTTGTGASHTGPCSVWVSGDFDGAEVILQGADADTAAKYSKLDGGVTSKTRFKAKGSCAVNAQGTYYLRAVLRNAGAGTSVTVITTQ